MTRPTVCPSVCGLSRVPSQLAWQLCNCTQFDHKNNTTVTEGFFELLTDGNKDEKVDTAIDGQTEVVEPDENVKPLTVLTLTLDVPLEEILGQVEDEPGEVAHQVEDDDHDEDGC